MGSCDVSGRDSAQTLFLCQLFSQICYRSANAAVRKENPMWTRTWQNWNLWEWWEPHGGMGKLVHIPKELHMCLREDSEKLKRWMWQDLAELQVWCCPSPIKFASRPTIIHVNSHSTCINFQKIKIWLLNLNLTKQIYVMNHIWK